MIVSQPLEFLAYRGNDFQLQVTYSVSFKGNYIRFPLFQTRLSQISILIEFLFFRPKFCPAASIFYVNSYIWLIADVF